MGGDAARSLLHPPLRHPEFSSGSLSIARLPYGVLKRVQDDEFAYAAFVSISFTASCRFIAPSTPSKVSSVGLPSSLSER